jgi:predicted RNA-binding protein with PUA-like domain
VAGWLLKTEPSEYSFADLVRERRTVWDGVTNPLALKYLRVMRGGDGAFIYHTGSERAIVGVARVVSDPYPAGGEAGVAGWVVDVEAESWLGRPVTLAEMKGSELFVGFQLLRLPRLSVMPVPPAIWRAVEELARQ